MKWKVLFLIFVFTGLQGLLTIAYAIHCNWIANQVGEGTTVYVINFIVAISAYACLTYALRRQPSYFKSLLFLCIISISGFIMNQIYWEMKYFMHTHHLNWDYFWTTRFPVTISYSSRLIIMDLCIPFIFYKERAKTPLWHFVTIVVVTLILSVLLFVFVLFISVQIWNASSLNRIPIWLYIIPLFVTAVLVQISLRTYKRNNIEEGRPDRVKSFHIASGFMLLLFAVVLFYPLREIIPNPLIRENTDSRITITIGDGKAIRTDQKGADSIIQHYKKELQQAADNKGSDTVR